MLINTVVAVNLALVPMTIEEVQMVNEKISNAQRLLRELPASEEAPLTLNSFDRKILPRHFRENTDSLLIPVTKQVPDASELPNSLGLETLRVSASAQPTEGEFQALADHYLVGSRHVTVVNLREESTVFINGHAISVFAATNLGNRGKSLSRINQEENALIDALKDLEITTIYKIVNKTALDTLRDREPVTMSIDRVASEEELVAQANLGYLRIPMTDHMRPNDQAVDAFVAAVRERGEDTHFHFHCWEGHGRTTTVMVMIDAMQNANKVNFEDIWKRQWWLGGEGSNMNNVPAKPSYKHELFDERAQFLSTFYRYCQENIHDNYQKSWTQFLRENNIRSF